MAWLSDQGRIFESKAFRDFCKEKNIKKVRTTSYHPQENGLTERTIRTIKQMLSAFVGEDHATWDLVLKDVS